MCTQQYGGPETATITGTWQGEPVNSTLSRKNGCEIARWDALKDVLPRLMYPLALAGRNREPLLDSTTEKRCRARSVAPHDRRLDARGRRLSPVARFIQR